MHERAGCRDEAASHQLPIVAAFTIVQIISMEEYSSLMHNLMQIHYIHFECDDHTVHMLTQRHLPPPLTSTVKSSLFMHVHSTPLSLAARLHRCHSNCSRDINNGWTFSWQASYVDVFYRKIGLKIKKKYDEVKHTGTRKESQDIGVGRRGRERKGSPVKQRPWRQ